MNLLFALLTAQVLGVPQPQSLDLIRETTLRAGPSISDSQIKLLESGAHCEILSRKNTAILIGRRSDFWYNVDCDGAQG